MSLYIKENIPTYEIQLQEGADCKEAIMVRISYRSYNSYHCILDPILPIPLHLPAHSRRNMELWYSNGLHHRWCCTPSCYTINNACTCRLCGERQPTKSYLISCRTSTLARHIVITPVNVNKVVNVFLCHIDVCNIEQCCAMSTFYLRFS